MPYTIKVRSLMDKRKERQIGWYRTEREAKADAKKLIPPWFTYEVVRGNPVIESIGTGLGLGAGFAVAHKVIDKVWKNPISEEAKLLKSFVTESDMRMLRPVLGTEEIGDVLKDICRRRGFRNTLTVHSALIELTHYKLPTKTILGTKNPVDIRAVRREIGEMFRRVKERKARGREMKRIWAKHKRLARKPNPLIEVEVCPKCGRKRGERHLITTKRPTIRTIDKWFDEGVARATDGCRVELDGACPHGHNSWLLVLGYI